MSQHTKHLKKEKKDTTQRKKSLGILKQEPLSNSSAWDRVQRARDQDRPSTKAIIETVFSNYIELHGDRYYGDDGAITGGIAYLKEMPVTVIGIIKGKDTEENIKAHFGMVHPEGYRKALRLMKQAEKFGRPIITLIDTPGAFPGIEAEERGQGEAIAQNLMHMMDLSVPSISIILGEAGSGGALALAVTDKVWMMENAMYCILSPEGFASILFKDAKKAPEIVELMKITSQDLLKLGVIDAIISEANGFDKAANTIHERLYMELSTLLKLKPEKLKRQRYKRFRMMGEVIHEH